MDILYNLIMATFRQTTPILLAATGGVYSDRSGLANITLEASMIMGAFFAVYGSYTYGSSAVGILFGLIAGVVTGVLFALICLYMGGNNVVVGISFNLIAWGLTTFLLLAIYGTTGSFVSRKIVSMPKYTVPVLSGLPVIGGLFKSQTIVAYFSVLFVVIILVHFIPHQGGHENRGLRGKSPGCCCGGLRRPQDPVSLFRNHQHRLRPGPGRICPWGW